MYNKMSESAAEMHDIMSIADSFVATVAVFVGTLRQRQQWLLRLVSKACNVMNFYSFLVTVSANEFIQNNGMSLCCFVVFYLVGHV